MEYYVDKFNRKYKPSVTPVVSGGGGTGMDLEADRWHAKRRKIINVERGAKTGDVITFDQTITHTPADGFTYNGEKYTLFKSGVDLTFTTVLRHLKVGKVTVFNADNKKISNVSEGVYFQQMLLYS